MLDHNTAPYDMDDQPDWMCMAVHRADITDAYQKVTDPENELGETCEACFDVVEVEAWDPNPYVEATAKQATLTGLVIDDGHGKRLEGRADAIGILGAETVSHIEEDQSLRLRAGAV